VAAAPLIGRASPAAVNNKTLGKQIPAGPSWMKRVDRWRCDVTQWTATVKKERHDVMGGRRQTHQPPLAR